MTALVCESKFSCRLLYLLTNELDMYAVFSILIVFLTKLVCFIAVTSIRA